MSAAHESSPLIFFTVSLLHVDDDDMKDFNNAKIRFTILGGTNSFSIDLSKIIKADSVNEAEEQLILVLEINDSTEVNLDRHGGVLVLKILDKNREI